MTHRAQGIFDAVVTAVTGLATTSSNVYSQRVYAIPSDINSALTVRIGSDELVGGDYSNTAFVDRVLTVYVRIHVKATEANLDNQLLTIEEEVWTALMTNITLNLSYVIQILPGGRAEPELEQGEKPIISCDTEWTIHYRHSVSDPGS